MDEVTRHPSRTMYAKERLPSWKRLLLDGEGLAEIPDPNQDLWLCRECAEEHHGYWDELWADYHRGLL